MNHRINDGVYSYVVGIKAVNDTDVCVQFLTQYKDAKNPDELQLKFQMILTKEELRNFGKFLQE